MDRPRKGQRFTSPAFQGRWVLTAGEYYSSGKWHGAWDVGCPIGTPVTAPVDATVGDLNDGVRNQPVGVPGGPGSPANWVLLHYRSPRYGPVTLWYQHLNRGVPVRKGQRVKAGQVVGYSGNSGNTYGPHLHLQAMRGYRRGTGRWVIYSDRSQNIFHPSASWAGITTTPPPEDDLTPEESRMLKHIYDTMTPGIRGRKHDGHGYATLKNRVAASAIAKAVWRRERSSLFDGAGRRLSRPRKYAMDWIVDTARVSAARAEQKR